MKGWPLKAALLAVVIIILAGSIGVARHRFNERRPPWEKYKLPRMEFRSEATVNVVAAINAAMLKASHGAVSQVVILDTTPASITKVGEVKPLSRHMDDMIAEFRRHEQDLVAKGASGYETAPFTGAAGGEVALCCFAMEVQNQTALDVRVDADSLYISRNPRVLECRAYYISQGLRTLMEQKRKANTLHVQAEPIVSAFVSASEMHQWDIMVPDGPNKARGEARFDKVFRHLPELGVILAIATPQDHADAEAHLKASGYWAAPK